MKYLLIIFFPIVAFSQKTTYPGFVVDKETKEKISFATIGFLKANSGMNADEEGRFLFSPAKYFNDTLIISCVGYETLKVSINRLPETGRFELTPRAEILKEVIVRRQRTKMAALNGYGWCGINSYTTVGYITQVAQQFNAPTENTMLTQINICKEGGYSKFRIRIYDVEKSSGKPFNDLSDSIIEISSDDGRVHLNLDTLGIHIPGKQFFVAVEWLRIPPNEILHKYKLNGKKKAEIWYAPFLKYKGEKEFHKEDKVWTKNFRGEWEPYFSKDSRMLISVNVKY